MFLNSQQRDFPLIVPPHLYHYAERLLLICDDPKKVTTQMIIEYAESQERESAYLHGWNDDPLR